MRRTIFGVALTVIALLAVSSVQADPVSEGIWYEFQWSGSVVSACTSCTPSSGGNSVFAGSPPWTFTAGSAGAILTVTDAFLRSDQFQIFDFGSAVGTTSAPLGSGNCGSDPVPCLADTNASSGQFVLAAGSHSITIGVNPPPSLSSGAAYLRWDSQSVPEPSTLLLLGLGLAGVGFLRKRR